jgi:hypothetical protein
MQWDWGYLNFKLSNKVLKKPILKSLTSIVVSKNSFETHLRMQNVSYNFFETKFILKYKVF